jgi:hypothetical protein
MDAGGGKHPETAKTARIKWLDVPGGPVASGQAVFVTGHLGRSGAGRPDGD